MNILQHRWDKYTSTGNDGVIEFIFKTLGKQEGFFVEFGAVDGIKGSNCRKLWEQDWKGIFIEADSDKYLQLVSNYKPEDLMWPWFEDKYIFEDVACIRSYVDRTENKFDKLVEGLIPPSGIDFCSIDIDGLDVEVFETFEKFLPSVVCIEGGQMLEPTTPRVPVHIAKNNIQQSLSTMVEVFKLRGYKLLCTYQDSFFIKEELCDKFDVSDDIVELYLDGLAAHPRRMPWIQMKLSEVNLENKIINQLLNSTNYSSYNYPRRKEWAKEQNKLILEKIKEIRKSL